MIAGYLLSVGSRHVVVLLVCGERECRLAGTVAGCLVPGHTGGGKSSLAYSDPCLAVVATLAIVATLPHNGTRRQVRCCWGESREDQCPAAWTLLELVLG